MESDRRHAERVHFEPLRVRVYGTREGILLDLSKGGARVQFPSALPIDSEITLQIDWNARALHVQARVLRCTARRVQLESATLARTEYDVALEFSRVDPEAAMLIRQILERK